MFGRLQAVGLTFLSAILATALLSVSFSGVSQAASAGLSLSDSVTSPAPGSKVMLIAELAVPGSGTFSNEIVQSIDPSKVVITSAADITAPAGWTVSYSTDGTNFTTVEPSTIAGWRAVRAVKATGSGDVVNGFPVSRGTSNAPSGGGASISAIGARGDGYDVIIDRFGRLFNMWHHDGSGYGPALDCHLRTGERCDGAWPFYIGFTSLYFSTGFINEQNDHLWFPTDNGPDLGFACIDLSTIATPGVCAGVNSQGFVALDEKVPWSWFDALGRTERIGDKLFAQSPFTGNLLCLDMAGADGNGAPCDGQPYSVPGLGTNDLTDLALGAQDGKVYIGSGTQATCFDPSTNGVCAGSWPVSITLPSTFVYAQPDASGAIVAMCFQHFSGVTTGCFSPTGSSLTPNPGLAFTLSFDGYGYSSIYPKNPVTVGSKVLTTDGDYSYGEAIGICHDVATNSVCPRWWQVIPKNYTMTLDPYDNNCVWTNGDDGVIRSYTISPAGPGCAPNATQALSLPPRVTTNSCGNTAGEPAGWISATMSAPAVSDYTSATFTMLDSDGAPITGWTELPLTGDRRIDLSSLPVSTTGDRPTVQVAYTGLSPAAVASQFSFEVAESAFTLCVSYMKACPAGPGVFTNIPGSTSTVEVSASATPSGGSTSTYNESASVVAPSPIESQCVKRLGFDTFIGGSVGTWGDGDDYNAWLEGDDPFAGAKAHILDLNGNPIIDPSTDGPLVVPAVARQLPAGKVIAVGEVELLPGLYRIRFNDEDGYALSDALDYNSYDLETGEVSNVFARDLSGVGQYIGTLEVTSPEEDPYSYWYSVNWVVAPPTPPTTIAENIDPVVGEESVGKLPATGSDSSLPVVLASFALILGGAGLELLRRRFRASAA